MSILQDITLKNIREMVLVFLPDSEEVQFDDYKALILKGINILSNIVTTFPSTNIKRGISIDNSFSPPPKAFIELSFDGASKGNPGDVGF